MDLEAAYRQALKEAVDIREHLPLLRRYALRCYHITEFGLRSGYSATAFLTSCPIHFVSYDKDPACDATFDRLRKLVDGKTIFEFRCEDTTKARIDLTDFLFIDGYHSAENVRQELANNKGRVLQYIGFHDTATYGLQGEDGKAPGILAPIEELIAAGGWEIIERHENNNGLIILKRGVE